MISEEFEEIRTSLAVRAPLWLRSLARLFTEVPKWLKGRVT